MLVNSISKNKKRLIEVTFSDSEVVMKLLSENTLIDCGIFKSAEINDEKLEEIYIHDAKNFVSKTIYNATSTKILSEKQIQSKVNNLITLYTKITTNEVDRAKITKSVFEILNKYELVNDKKFVNSFIDKFRSNPKFGRRKIQMELRQKGISQDNASDVYKNITDEEEYENCLTIAQKKLRSLNYDNALQMRDKISRFLIQRGFALETIRKVISNL